MISYKDVDSLTPLLLLTTIFCGLVAVLFLYGKLTSYLKQRSPEVNKQKLQDWLTDRLIRLPTAEDIVKECNRQSERITPVPGGVEWRNLRVERLLPSTSLPEFSIIKIISIKDDEIRFKCCLQWPDCVPGVELSVLLGNEKVLFHLQVDWILMFAEGVIRVLPEGGVALSWVQTDRVASALSCMVTHPPHMKVDIDINKPLLENPNIQESEGVSSSVAEGLLQLIKNFKLMNYMVPPVKETKEDCEEDRTEFTEETEKKDKTVSIQQKDVVDKVLPNVEQKGIAREQRGSVERLEESEKKAGEDERPKMETESKKVEVVQEEVLKPVGVSTRTEDDVGVSAPQMPVPFEQVSESSGSKSPVVIKAPTEDTQTSSNGYSPSYLMRRWDNHLPVITEPSKEEFSPEREESKTKPTTNKELGEKKEDDSLNSSPSLWRRSFHEDLKDYESPQPAPKPLPTYLRVLTYSDEDLSKMDNKSSDGKHQWSRSTTLSIRSYDTDSPMTDASGQFLSTVVFEVEDRGHRKHIVAMNPAHATRLRKQLGRYTKLHIYNDHTFTAKHIRGKQTCAVCGDKITGLFGKQAYICRDCSLTVHKNCHHKTEASCLRSQVSTLNLIYPENVTSYSPQ